jgi:hypothetical protein
MANQTLLYLGSERDIIADKVNNPLFLTNLWITSCDSLWSIDKYKIELFHFIFPWYLQIYFDYFMDQSAIQWIRWQQSIHTHVNNMAENEWM